MASDTVKVAVRVRPINKREIELGTKIVVDMEDNQTILQPVSDRRDNRKQVKVFAFDHCFWSMDDTNPKYAGQEHVFNSVGRDILERAFEGYNGCIFAYGQTGSGKSYTMMGGNQGNDKGIIPRLCDSLFDHIATHGELNCKVEVSYMEIYNEKIHDLLASAPTKDHQENLRVREHKVLGPYVDGLSQLAVNSFEDIDNLMAEGNKSRTVASTNMNSESSRSHAVFSIIVTQTLTDTKSGVSGEKVSKLSLVDLAGSERAQKTGAVGERLKEGSNINKSLTTLGLVISALADQGKKGTKFTPYRDSTLTWILKDNLGGNSKTVMVATISPSADNYEETLSTLRYADRAKHIVNHAVINEDPNARIIRELREEVEVLREQLTVAKSMQAPELQERLVESEKLMKEMTKTWEEKLTESQKVHEERHKALEQMGVSVNTSGIRLDNTCPSLVNLNADPYLNELLVYYLKQHTLVGRPDAKQQQDIQLSGLGIANEHAILDVDNNEVFITPLEGAKMVCHRFGKPFMQHYISRALHRKVISDGCLKPYPYFLRAGEVLKCVRLTCVNGSVIKERQKVKHGDRIVWGNNHFFKLNCPRPANSPQSPDTEEQQQRQGYDFAQQELMEKELGNDPIQEAMWAIEKQHEEDKQEALDKQRQMYEEQMNMLRSQQMSPGTPSFAPHALDLHRMTPSTSTSNSIQRKYQQWAQDREKNFRLNLAKLREDVVKANALVRDANTLSVEMGRDTEFHVTLQIPAANLSPNRRKGTFISEPAIAVKRKNRNTQIWTLEKLENKIISMREMYEDRKAQGLPLTVDDPSEDLVDDDSSWDKETPREGDPFNDCPDNHNLIGVANIFLDCLFYDVKLDYHVPIISQQGEVAGKLHVEISTDGRAVFDHYLERYKGDDEESTGSMGAPLFIQVCIHDVRGLPAEASNFVFCQYNFSWAQPESIVVAPEINPDIVDQQDKDTTSYIFNHKKKFRVPITNEFIDFCSDGALSIEVWGNRSNGFGKTASESEFSEGKSRSVTESWNEVMRKIEMRVEFHEVNDQGEYAPVEVLPKPDVPCAGVFQLRQGHARRLLVRLKPVANTGTLPLICEYITSLHIGCLNARSRLQKGLDSYQEEDLNVLRDRWIKALIRRKQYLDEQFQKLINQPDKTESDAKRELTLINQLRNVMDERNAVQVPPAGSNIPGAPADWNPPPNMEEHSPVLFLDLNADDMSTPKAREGMQAVGMYSILPKEHSDRYVDLPHLKCYREEDSLCASASWDSSLHESPSLNRVTPANERLYMVVKVVVKLSHPASMEIVLRKRVAINIYKKQGLTSSITNMLKNRIYGSDYQTDSGVMYEVVSNLPKSTEELEDLETLAEMAASDNDQSTTDGETYIEKYIKGISAVESILTLDRLRQEVAVRELMTAPVPLRKTTSVPNIHKIVTSPTGLLQQQFRADSVHDLSLVDQFSPKSHNFPARPNFLSLRSSNRSSPNAKSTPKMVSPMSAGSGKAMKPMMTLVEEQHHREIKPLLHQDTEEDLDEEDDLPAHPRPPVARRLMEPDTQSIDSDDYQEFESYQSQQSKNITMKEQAAPAAVTSVACTAITPSSTTDSLTEAPVKGYTPSMTSSGYGSQAVSTLTLSSDDSISVKSMEEQCEGAAKGGQSNASLKRASTEASTDSDTEDGSGSADKNQLLEEEEEDGNEPEAKSHSSEKMDEQEAGVGGRARSDSLLDEQVPDIKDSPLQPVASPPIGGSTPFFSEEGEDRTQAPEAENDPYSVTAMEELERLGEEEEGDGDNTSMMDTSVSSTKTADSQSQPDTPSANRGEPDTSTPKDADKKGGMPKSGSAKKRGTGARPRPKSMVVSPQAEVLTRAWQDDINRRSSLHLSEDSLPAIEDDISECSFGSRADLDRLTDVPVPGWVKEGEGVTVTSSSGPSKTGVVRFVGRVNFAPGNWVGVELDQAEGKNDGSVKGERYFSCMKRHGIFVRPDKLIWDKKRKQSRKGSNPASRRSTPGLSDSSSNLSRSFSGASPSSQSSYLKSTSASIAKKK